MFYAFALPRLLRMESPFISIRCALWTSRSRIPSARVGSTPSTAPWQESVRRRGPRRWDEGPVSPHTCRWKVERQSPRARRMQRRLQADCVIPAEGGRSRPPHFSALLIQSDSGSFLPFHSCPFCMNPARVSVFFIRGLEVVLNRSPSPMSLATILPDKRAP